MTTVVAVTNGKGGVKKSTISRIIAVEYTKAGWEVLGLDMDIDQGSFIDWGQRRLRNGIQPPVNIQGCGTVAHVKKIISSGQWDLIVIDCAAYATKSIFSLAEISDLLILPSAYSVDDLRTTVTTINALKNRDFPTDKLSVVFAGVSENESEHKGALEYLAPCGVQVIPGAVPFLTNYSQAQDKGLALTETSFPGPRAKADFVLQGIINKINQITG